MPEDLSSFPRTWGGRVGGVCHPARGPGKVVCGRICHPSRGPGEDVWEGFDTLPGDLGRSCAGGGGWLPCPDTLEGRAREGLSPCAGKVVRRRVCHPARGPEKVVCGRVVTLPGDLGRSCVGGLSPCPGTWGGRAWEGLSPWGGRVREGLSPCPGTWGGGVLAGWWRVCNPSARPGGKKKKGGGAGKATRRRGGGYGWRIDGRGAGTSRRGKGGGGG